MKSAISVALIASASILLLACSEEDASIANANGQADTQETVASNDITLDVYKTETCGCCGIWTEYMQANGFAIRIHHPEDLNTIKDQYGIAPQWQSCHTAVSSGGYFFEGHIPVKFVNQFLQNPPDNAAGLATPGMPLGSPGMEVGDRFTPYDIVLLKKDGSAETYATINNAQDQF